MGCYITVLNLRSFKLFTFNRHSNLSCILFFYGRLVGVKSITCPDISCWPPLYTNTPDEFRFGTSIGPLKKYDD